MKDQLKMRQQGLEPLMVGAQRLTVAGLLALAACADTGMATVGNPEAPDLQVGPGATAAAVSAPICGATNANLKVANSTDHEGRTGCRVTSTTAPGSSTVRVTSPDGTVTETVNPPGTVTVVQEFWLDIQSQAVAAQQASWDGAAKATGAATDFAAKVIAQVLGVAVK